MNAVTQSALRFLGTHMPSAAASGGTAVDALAADAAPGKVCCDVVFWDCIKGTASDEVVCDVVCLLFVIGLKSSGHC